MSKGFERARNALGEFFQADSLGGVARNGAHFQNTAGISIGWAQTVLTYLGLTQTEELAGGLFQGLQVIADQLDANRVAIDALRASIERQTEVLIAIETSSLRQTAILGKLAAASPPMPARVAGDVAPPRPVVARAAPPPVAAPPDPSLAAATGPRGHVFLDENGNPIEFEGVAT
jgi:hypothetical protein